MDKKEKTWWKITCSWEVYSVAHVKAETLEEAIKISEQDDFPLPTDTNYVNGSFRADPEISKLLN